MPNEDRPADGDSSGSGAGSPEASWSGTEPGWSGGRDEEARRRYAQGREAENN
ncbi:MAG: hypothetical protein WA761_00275 [Thermoplasmata archaeon]